ncbi:MAG: peptide-methionine (S)-S-oxide reductase MsrA [Spirochaetales bacterium]
MAEQNETIVLGGGCFWCIEAVYKRQKGVVSATSGYAGGTSANPTYEAVCSGETGHAEVVKVDYNPAEVSLEEILRLFFNAHDPTTLNRQGHDVGTQYRSAIYYTDEQQRAVIERVRDEVAATLTKPVVTEVAPLDVFYEAEAYHQDYFDTNPNAGYCRAVIAPKINKLDIPKMRLL